MPHHEDEAWIHSNIVTRIGKAHQGWIGTIPCRTVDRAFDPPLGSALTKIRCPKNANESHNCNSMQGWHVELI